MNGSALSLATSSSGVVDCEDGWQHPIDASQMPGLTVNGSVLDFLDTSKDRGLPLTTAKQSTDLNRLSLIDEWPQEEGAQVCSDEVSQGTSQKRSEKREVPEKNNKKTTSGLAFHRRQSSGDLYTKLQHFDNGDILPDSCQEQEQQQHCSNSMRGESQVGGLSNRYVVRGHGLWGDFDDPNLRQTSTRKDETSICPSNTAISDSSQYEILPLGSAKGVSLPSENTNRTGVGSGGVAALKEWYKNRTLVLKATSKVEAPPKPKYLCQLVLSCLKHDGSGAAFIFKTLSKRPILSSPVIALKALITIHKVLQQGAPVCRRMCYIKIQMLIDIQKTFKDGAASAAFGRYNSVVSAYATFLVEKASFHNMFPAFENNYSVDLSACEGLPRFKALAHLQKIQNKILATLEECFALLGKTYDAIDEKSTGTGRRMDPTGAGGAGALVRSGECNPIELVVAMLIPVLREADILYDICWFLISTQAFSARETGHQDSNSMVASQEFCRKFGEQHKMLRAFFERARSEAVITSTVTPPDLPLNPPLLMIPAISNNEIPYRCSLGTADTGHKVDDEPLDDVKDPEVERPKSVPLDGNGTADDHRARDDAPGQEMKDWRQHGVRNAGWSASVSKAPQRQQSQEISGPVVGGVGAAAAAAMQRFAAGQAEVRRAAAAAAAVQPQAAGLKAKSIRLGPPPRTTGFNSKVEPRTVESGGFLRPEKPQHTRGIGRTWSSFDDEAFLHKKFFVGNNPWSPNSGLISPKFYSPKAPGPPSKEEEEHGNCKSSSPLLFPPPPQRNKPQSPSSECLHNSPVPVPPAQTTNLDLRHSPPVAVRPLLRQPQQQQQQQQHQQVQDFLGKTQECSTYPLAQLNGLAKVERPETPPMIEMETPDGVESTGNTVDNGQRQPNVVIAQEEAPRPETVAPFSWQLGGSMSDAAAWSAPDYPCSPDPGHLGGTSCRKEARQDMPVAADWEIPASELKLGPKIGQGAFGDVLRGSWQGTDVAVKRLQNSFGVGYSQAIEEIRNEVAVIMRLRHPNIILFMGACTIPPEICIVMEFAANGSLFGVLHNPNIAIDMATVVRWASEAAKGMNYLHTRNPPVVHRDLKSVNLLVDEDWHIKVSDFGLAMTKQNSYAHTQVGTWGWMAPEVLESAPYNEKADVYSFGVVLWELITREEPFKGYHPMQIMRAIDRGERPPIPPSCPYLYRRLVTDCWHADPKRRPVFVEVLIRLGDIINTLNLPAGHHRRSSSGSCSNA